MPVFKTVLHILNKNKLNLMIGLVVTFVIVFFMSGEMQNNQEKAKQIKITVIDKDKSEFSEALTTHIGKQQKLVSLKETTQKALDDALYFEEVSYILWIPKGFSEKLNKGENPKLKSQTKPGTFNQELANTTINQFINTYLTYQQALPNSSEHDLLTMTNETTNEKGTVKQDKSYDKLERQSMTAIVFNMLAYGLFMTIFSGYGYVNLTFNEEELAKRNRCTPVPSRILSQQISLANLSYAFLMILIFGIFVLTFTRSSFNQFTLYLLINLACFSATMISFSSFITSIIKNSEAISGISNVFIMGSCFVTGVFVSSSILPDVVNKIAAFLPTYWFVQNNELVAKTQHFNQEFINKFGFQCFVLLAFAGVFLILQMILKRDRKSNHLLFSK